MSETLNLRRFQLAGWVVLVAVLAISTVLSVQRVSAQAPAAEAPFEADSEQAEPLLEQLRESYRILSLTDSYVLQPTSEDGSDFESIQIKAGTVAVDGQTVSRPKLRELIGDDADIIFDLSALGSEAWAATEDLRGRIERMAGERRLRAEDIEELIRSRVDELENLNEEHLEVIEDALEKQRRSERGRGSRGRVRTDTRVSFGSSLTIDDNETSQDVVVLGGSLDVDGKVSGDAVIVGGSAEVQGEVSGTVTVIGGSIVLGPEGRIYGDAISIGGAVHRDSGAEVFGEITEVSLGPGFELDDLWEGVWGPDWHFDWFDFGIGELITRLGKAVILAILLLLIVLLFPRLCAGVAERAELDPWKAGLVGLGTQLLFLFALPVISIILLVTIVGIPLALILGPVATLALVVLFFLGFAGLATAGGRWLQQRFDWRDASPYMLVLLGLVLIQGWSILGEALGFLGGVLGFVGGPIKLIGWSFLLLGFVIKYIAWTVGLGAVLLYRFSPKPGAVASYPPGPPMLPSDGQNLEDLRRAAAWDETTVEAETEVPPPPPDPDEEYLTAADDDPAAQADESEDEAGDEGGDEADDGDRPGKQTPQ